MNKSKYNNASGFAPVIIGIIIIVIMIGSVSAITVKKQVEQKQRDSKRVRIERFPTPVKNHRPIEAVAAPRLAAGQSPMSPSNLVVTSIENAQDPQRK